MSNERDLSTLVVPRAGVVEARGDLWEPIRMTEELVARLRRAGATDELVMLFDSGFWSNTTIATLSRLGVGYTMGVRMV